MFAAKLKEFAWRRVVHTHARARALSPSNWDLARSRVFSQGVAQIVIPLESVSLILYSMHSIFFFPD